MVSTRPGSPTVALPRGLLLGLCGALVLALLAVAFLVGRLTARGGDGATTAHARPTAAGAGNGRLGTEPPASAAPGLGAPSEGRGADPLPEEWQALGSPAPPAGPSETAGERAAVAAYFGQIERLETANRSWSDPQQLAWQILQQGAQGDRRGLDELLAAARRARQALSAVAPPPPCRQHHRESLALIDAALDLLGRLAPALSGGDFGALESLAGAAHELEARARRLQSQEGQLRQRYDLPGTAR